MEPYENIELRGINNDEEYQLSSKYLSLDEHGNPIPEYKSGRFEENKLPPSIQGEYIVPYESFAPKETASRTEKQTIADHIEIQVEAKVTQDPNRAGTSNNKKFHEKYENRGFITEEPVMESQKVVDVADQHLCTIAYLSLLKFFRIPHICQPT